MSNTDTITVNGRRYDAHTGLLIDSVAPAKAPAPAHKATPAAQAVTVRAGARPVRSGASTARAVHSTAQRSHTLNRKATRRPAPAATAAAKVASPVRTHTATATPQPAHTITPRRAASNPVTAPKPASRSSHIAKFAPHPQTATNPAAKQSADIGPITHPHVAKAHAASLAKAQAKTHPAAPAVKTSHEIKNEAIQKAIEGTRKHPTKAKKRFLNKHPRAMTIVSAAFALVLLSGYLTYLNMPSLSVRVAAAQAGIDAQYPSYRPDGYSLSGPVAYNPGEVSMRFAANGGPQAFTITQTKSSWDSASVLDNYVAPKAGYSYTPYTERGLTIYTYGNNAAWVNGGILYTVEGDAPLSSDQIRRIATSLI